MGAGTRMHPGRHPGLRFRIPGRGAFQTIPVVTPAVPGVGPTGAATFLLLLESGAKITYSWSTDIFRSYSGNEQRASPFGQPRQRIEGSAFLLGDAVSRDTRSALMRAAAAGSTFLVALPFEELVLEADSVGTVVTGASTASCDWALPGQRVVVIGTDGTTLRAVVQSATPTTITLGVVDASNNLVTVTGLGTTGRAGGRVLPLLPVLLDPQQGFARYPVTLDSWSLRAQAAVFGWAGVDAMGVGTQVTTYTAGRPVDVATLTAADLLIWDRPNAIDGTAADAMLSGAELVDLGALPLGIGGQTVPDWTRPIRLISSSRDDWQWFKAFVRHLRGRQGAFLLPTGRDDLVLVSKIANRLQVASAAVAGAGDYTSWFVSAAHRRLAVTLADGTIQYVAVTGLVDRGDGTLSLTLDTSIIGAIVRLSFLEQVRFEEDDIPVTWDGGTFSIDLVARAVQETIVPPLRFLFDKVLETALPPSVSAVLLGGVLGQATLINVTSTASRSVAGIHAAGGNVDGMVVCCCCVNDSSAGMIMLEEDASGVAPPEDRLRHVGRLGVGAVRFAIWYVYSAALQRWVEILQT